MPDEAKTSVVELAQLDAVDPGADEVGEQQPTIDDLEPVRVGSEQITHQTRSHIARVLTWATIITAGTIGAVCAVCIVKIIWYGRIEQLEKITPLLTLLLSQTLVPLTTISITWYFASRHGSTSRDSG